MIGNLEISIQDIWLTEAGCRGKISMSLIFAQGVQVFSFAVVITSQ